MALPGHVPFQRALVATRWYPFPLYGGAFLYTWQLINAVAKVAKDTLVVCRSRPGAYSPPPPSKSIRFECADDPLPGALKRNCSALPHAATAVDSPRLRSLLQHALWNDPDLVVLDHLGACWAWSAIERHKRERSRDAVVLYCTHNEEASTRLSVASSCGFHPVRLAHWVDYARITRMDRRLLQGCDYVTCISTRDAGLYESSYGRRANSVLQPAWTGPVVHRRQIDESIGRRVVISGSFTWEAKKNDLLSFLAQAFSILAEKRIMVRVAGRIEPGLKNALTAQYEGLEVTGEVESMAEHLAASRIGLMIDASGGGFKLKSIEYVFHRVPIFALRSSVVDLPLREPSGIRMFDTNRELAHAVLENIDEFEALNRQQETAFSALRHIPRELSLEPWIRGVDHVPQERRERRQAAGADEARW